MVESVAALPDLSKKQPLIPSGKNNVGLKGVGEGLLRLSAGNDPTHIVKQKT